MPSLILSPVIAAQDLIPSICINTFFQSWSGQMQQQCQVTFGFHTWILLDYKILTKSFSMTKPVKIIVLITTYNL